MRLEKSAAEVRKGPKLESQEGSVGMDEMVSGNPCEDGSSAANVTEFDDLQLLPVSDGATGVGCFSVCS